MTRRITAADIDDTVAEGIALAINQILDERIAPLEAKLNHLMVEIEKKQQPPMRRVVKTARSHAPR